MQWYITCLYVNFFHVDPRISEILWEYVDKGENQARCVTVESENDINATPKLEWLTN